MVDAAQHISDIVGDRALAWIYRHLPDFDPLQTDTNPSEFQQTIVAELALLAIVLRRHYGEFASLPLRKLIARCWENRQYQQTALSVPESYHAYLMAWAALSGWEGEPAYFQERRDQTIDRIDALAGAAEANGHAFFRLRYLCRRLRLPVKFATVEDVFPRTYLAHVAANRRYAMSDYALYEFVHELFYLTDFSATPLTALGGSLVDPIDFALHGCLERALSSGNWDLVAEILIAHMCVGRRDARFLERGWQALALAQEPDGMVGLGLPWPDAEEHEIPASISDLRFHLCYHRTLVTVIANCVTRDADSMPRRFLSPIQ